MSVRRQAGIASHPLLVGAIAVLLVIAGVWLAYNSNSGLPFVPRYAIAVDVPSVGHMGKGAEVRLGGSRVGRIQRLAVLPHAGGQPTGRLYLELDERIAPLPSDTTFRIRPTSAVGTDYLQVVRGRARTTIRDGSVVPERQLVKDGVPLEDFLGTFDARTRAGIRASIEGLATGLAGRGPQVGEAIAILPALLGDLAPVMATLAAPSTDLPRLVRGLRAVTGELAPVAEQQGELVGELAATFDALSRNRPELGDAIEQSPGVADAVVASAPESELLHASTELLRRLRPAAEALPVAAEALADAVVTGEAGLPAVGRLAPRLRTGTAALRSFAVSPANQLAVDRLAQTGTALAPLASFLAPMQTTCRYGSLLLRNLTSSLSEGPTSGRAVRASIVAVTAAPNSEAVLASAPSRGPDGKALGSLHAVPYGATASPGQPRECEPGNERFVAGQPVIGSVPGRQPARTEPETRP